jgi:hypothetical protein
LTIRKSVLAVTLVVSLLVGAAAGFGGGYYKYVHVPKVKAQELAKKQQEELNKMVRHGEAKEVEPDAITIEVTKGGGDVGQAITVTTNEYTSVQVGMGFVNKPGEKTDLTKWFRPGDRVDALVKDGQAVALHRELRPDEHASQVQEAQRQLQGQQQRGQQQK